MKTLYITGEQGYVFENKGIAERYAEANELGGVVELVISEEEYKVFEDLSMQALEGKIAMPIRLSNLETELDKKAKPSFSEVADTIQDTFNEGLSYAKRFMEEKGINDKVEHLVTKTTEAAEKTKIKAEEDVIPEIKSQASKLYTSISSAISDLKAEDNQETHTEKEETKEEALKEAKVKSFMNYLETKLPVEEFLKVSERKDEIEQLVTNSKPNIFDIFDLFGPSIIQIEEVKEKVEDKVLSKAEIAEEIKNKVFANARNQITGAEVGSDLDAREEYLENVAIRLVLEELEYELNAMIEDVKDQINYKTLDFVLSGVTEEENSVRRVSIQNYVEIIILAEVLDFNGYDMIEEVVGNMFDIKKVEHKEVKCACGECFNELNLIFDISMSEDKLAKIAEYTLDGVDIEDLI